MPEQNLLEGLKAFVYCQTLQYGLVVHDFDQRK